MPVLDMMTRQLGIFVLLTIFLRLSLAQQCYYPSGGLAKDTPCDASAKVSTCCMADGLCLSNGLCLNKDGIMGRGSCTDQNWGPGCAPFCRQDNPQGGSIVWPCSFDEKLFTCGGDHRTCATNNFTIGAWNLTLRSYQVEDTLSASNLNISSYMQTAPETTPSSAAIATGTPLMDDETKPSSKTYSPSFVAGIVLGVSIPLLIALIGISWLLWKERAKAQRLAQSRKAIDSNYFPCYRPEKELQLAQSTLDRETFPKVILKPPPRIVRHELGEENMSPRR